jgi:hypothetical protein
MPSFGFYRANPQKLTRRLPDTREVNVRVPIVKPTRKAAKNGKSYCVVPCIFAEKRNGFAPGTFTVSNDNVSMVTELCDPGHSPESPRAKERAGKIIIEAVERTLDATGDSNDPIYLC